MPLLYEKARSRGSRLPTSWWSRGSNGTFAGIDNLGDELTPKMPLINVVRDFPWTLTPTNGLARKEAPVIRLREFLQLETVLNQSFQPYGKSFDFQGPFSNVPVNPAGQTDTLPSDADENAFLEALERIGDLTDLFAGAIKSDVEPLYKGLFDHLTSTDFIYELPYFTTEYFDINNTWEGSNVLDIMVDFQTKVTGAAADLTRIKLGEESKLAQFIQNLPANIKKIEMFNIKASSPAVGLMDPPHVWKGTQNRTYTFEFPLYNISSTGSTHANNLIQRNWEFCFLLTYQNLVNKRNFFSGIPPVFYEVTIPGVHYCKASYISDLNITNLGNIRLMELPINNNPVCEVIIPDAWSIQITLTDLLQPSKNLLQANLNTTLRDRIRGGEL